MGIDDHIKAKDLVLQTLEADTTTRNSDLWLILQTWRLQGIKIYVNYKDLPKMITPETITRVRRKIQNGEKRFLPTDPEVMRQRRIRQSELTSFYSSH